MLAARADHFVDEFHALTTAENKVAAAETERSSAGLQAASGLERRIDRAAVEDYLRRHPLGGEHVAVIEARLISGGRCKTTGLVTQAGSDRLPRDFILRQDWQGGATDTSVSGEFDLLARVSGAGICAPRPLLLEPRATPVGEPFILLQRLPGKLSGSLFTPPLSASLALQLADQMGRLHALPASEFRGLVPDGTKSNAQRREILGGFCEMQARI